MTATAYEIARERQLDWLLHEVLGGTARRAAARPTWRRSHWLAAGIATLAVGVAFGVAMVQDRGGAAATQDREREQPVDPEPEIWHHCYGPDQLGDVPADVVNLKGYDFTDDTLPKLARFSKLQKLDLGGTQPDARNVIRPVPITDAGVVELQALTSLRWLSLTGCHDVEGTTLGRLAAIPQLEHLDLGWTGLTSDGVAALTGLQHLRTLVLSGCLDFHGRSLADVARLPGLRRLELRGCATVSAEHVMQLAGLHELQHLDLRHCMGAFRGQTAVFEGAVEPTDEPVQDGIGVTDAAVAALRDLPLVTLKLGGCVRLSDAIAEHVDSMQQLRHLDLAELPQTTAALLRGLPTRLESLSLSGNRHYERDGLRAIARLRDLQQLELDGLPQLDDDLLAAILAPLDLRTLSIGGEARMGGTRGPDGGIRPDLSAAASEPIATQRNLRELCVSYADWLTAPAATTLAAMPNLERLDARCARLDAPTLAALARSASLHELKLRSTVGLTMEAVRELAALRTLRQLELYGTGLPVDELRELVTSWPGCRTQLTNGAWVDGE